VYHVAHRSLGHHTHGGSLADIFVPRNATRWLRLYGYWKGAWSRRLAAASSARSVAA
jgi:hypothetical protein